MFQRTCRVSGLVCAALAVCAAQAAGSPFMMGVNFVGRPAYSFGDVAATEVAGAIPQANWNNACGGCGTLTGLSDAGGDATGVHITWRADTDYLAVPDESADHRLMRGHLTPLGTDPITVTVTGLGAVAIAPYDVLVYFDAYNPSADLATVFEIGSIALDGTDRAGADFDGTFVQDTGDGGNYVRFDGLSGDAFTLEVSCAAGGPAAVNALQIHGAPEPATLLLMAVGAAGAVGRSTDRRAGRARPASGG